MIESTFERPDISIVVTARNDDHGGGFMRRMQIFTNALLAQAQRHELKAELIVVDWNPPQDRPPLYEALYWPDKNEFCSVRFIEIPPKIHNQYIYSGKLPLYQMIAKNVAIRRSRGQFILASNIDIIFSDALIKFMASGKLAERHVYRVDRYDIPADIPFEADIGEQLRFCEENVIRINALEGTRNFLTGRYFPTYGGLNTDSTRLHFNACGDFTLMSINDWNSLRGYPEFDMYSAHIDSLMMLMAYHSGVRQVILPENMRTYHIEHSSSMIAEIAGKLAKDLKAKGVPELRMSQLEEWSMEMNRMGRPILFNSQEWGFANEDLRETVVLRSEWEGRSVPAKDIILQGKADKIALSVIIVDQNRKGSLVNCIDSLTSQSLDRSLYELVVITKDSEVHKDIIRKCRNETNIRFITDKANGLSAAYAAGVIEARGEVLLFIQDNTTSDKNLLYEHFTFHKNNPPVNNSNLALLGQTNFSMLGLRSMTEDLKGAPLTEFKLSGYEGLNDGETLDWHHFRWDNLSCQKDLIIRYGNFDETFNRLGDIELGYRLSKHNISIVYNGQARTYVSNEPVIAEFSGDAALDGAEACLFAVKHPDSEVLNHFTKVYEHHFFKGASTAGYDRTSIIKKVFGARLSQKTKLAAGEKTILIIVSQAPLSDQKDNSFICKTLNALSKKHNVILVVRNANEKEGNIVQLRKDVAIVYYDLEGLQKQAFDKLVKTDCAGAIKIKELLETVNCDLVIFESPEIAPFYLNTVRECSPHSAILISAHGAGKRPVTDNEYMLEMADLVILNAEDSGFLMSRIRMRNVIILDESLPEKDFEIEFKNIINSPPDPKDVNLSRFRLSEKKLLNTGKSECHDNTVIFIVKELGQMTEHSLDNLRRYSSVKTPVIVAISSNIDIGMSSKLEKELKPYFIYKNEQELVGFILSTIRNSGSYVTVLESGIVVPPHWEERLISHFSQDALSGIVTPQSTNSFYMLLYDFEEDAWSVYQDNKGKNSLSERLDIPCAVIKSSCVGSGEFETISQLLSTILLKGYHLLKAEDTLVWNVKTSDKVKKVKFEFKNSTSKLLSVIIPSYNSKLKLLRCLKSFFGQKNTDFSKIEIIVVDDGSTDDTYNELAGIKAPCSFILIRQQHMGRTAAINHAIKESSGRIILFSLPEAIADENLISEHLAAHRKYGEGIAAVAGHIYTEQGSEDSPFAKFLHKSPNIEYKAQTSYDFNEIVKPENLDHRYFYLPNISLPRNVFQTVGLFSESLSLGMEELEFGVRFTFNNNRIIYCPGAAVSYASETTLEDFLLKQFEIGKQAANLAMKHPSTWNLQRIKRNCVYNFFKKDALITLAEKYIRELELLPEGVRNGYKYAGLPLLERCCFILLNYHFAMGINTAISNIEGDDWISSLNDPGVTMGGILNENLAYKLILEAYFSAGQNDMAAFSRAIEHASSLVPTHPAPYFAAANFYFNYGEYKLAEVTFEEGLEKRISHKNESLIPLENEVLFCILLAMSCIPQGKYQKAASLLEKVILERSPITMEQGVFIFKSLSLCYKALGKIRRGQFCLEESERLREGIGA